MRLVMMGTGGFARPTFEALYGSPHDVVGLFTQPDRPAKGRRPPRNLLKELAEERGTPVFQPPSVNAADSLQALKSLNADLTVIAAYGQILSAEVIDAPQLGSINLHGSLLPKYRGAAPVQYAVWYCEPETGVTIFQLEPKLDAGPILGKVRTPIGPKETSGELMGRLADLAAPLTLEVLSQIADGRTCPEPQHPAGVTVAPRLKKEDGLIDWSQLPCRVDCQIRAMQPWPKPYTYLHQPGSSPRRVLVLEVEPLTEVSAETPGTIIRAEADRLAVATRGGSVAMLRIQPDGKRAMTAEEFLRGYRVKAGDRFRELDDGC